MKLNELISRKTLKISFPFGKSLIFAFILIPLIIMGLELLMATKPVPESLLVPSFDKKIPYPEIDIKLLRMGFWEKTKRINCLILGSSIVDYGFDPSSMDGKADFLGVQEPHCFNMALRGVRPNTNSSVASILMNRFEPELILIGLSPIDFAGENEIIREFKTSPWFLYQEGQVSFQGWLIDNSHLYRYWLSFLKYRDPSYLGEMQNLRLLINDRGLQIRQKNKKIFIVKPVIQIPKFEITQEEINGLKKIASMNNENVRVIVFEMPSHPDLIPYYVPGGTEGYEKLFVEPVTEALREYGIPFIRTQDEIRQVISPEGWQDQIHVNEVGSRRFSQWFVEKLTDMQ